MTMTTSEGPVEGMKRADVAPIDRALLDLDAAVNRIDNLTGMMRERLDPILRPSEPESAIAMSGRLSEVTGPQSTVTARIRESVDRANRIADNLDVMINRVEA